MNMNTIRAIVRNGQIELQSPVDLPEGTELIVMPTNAVPMIGLKDSDELDTPEAIAASLRRFDEWEPLEFTEQELADWEAARRAAKDADLAEWKERSKRLEKLFP